MLAFLKKLFRWKSSAAPLQAGERVKVANNGLNRTNAFWVERIGSEGLVVFAYPNGDLMVQMNEDPPGITCDNLLPGRFTRAS